jgi:hypothetical protein
MTQLQHLTTRVRGRPQHSLCNNVFHATVTRCSKPLTSGDRHRDEMSPPTGLLPMTDSETSGDRFGVC